MYARKYAKRTASCCKWELFLGSCILPCSLEVWLFWMNSVEVLIWQALTPFPPAQRNDARRQNLREPFQYYPRQRKLIWACSARCFNVEATRRVTGKLDDWRLTSRINYNEWRMCGRNSMIPRGYIRSERRRYSSVVSEIRRRPCYPSLIDSRIESGAIMPLGRSISGRPLWTRFI